MSGVAQARQQAWKIYEQFGLPGTKQEDWKYTDLSRLARVLGEQWWKSAKQGSLDAQALAQLEITGLDADRLVFVDGYFKSELSSLPKGVRIRPLSRLMIDEPEAADDLLACDVAAPLFSGTVAVNAALASDGACIDVTDGVRLPRPLYLLHVATQEGAAHLRHSIRLGKHAQAHVIEHFAGCGDMTGLTHCISNITLGEGAVLDHDRLQMESTHQFHLGRLDVAQRRDSQFRSHVVTLGAALSRLDVVVQLDGEGASCALNGLYLITGRQHADHHTSIQHLKPHGISRENYRGVLDGRAHGVFNGSVVVHPGAAKTDSAQSNANLLLSDKAEIDTKPELVIHHDDVKAAHGCTVGQLDATQLFYLRSRGLSAEESRQVLTFAFADSVLSGMKSAATRRFVESAAFARLPHADDLEEMLR